jgi:hypothetical protein|tara:strand:- start:1094 stop:1201 length:108 start_codon:yes stop_codon:yes gene_type:complete
MPEGMAGDTFIGYACRFDSHLKEFAHPGDVQVMPA